MNIFPSFVVDKRRFYSKNSTHLFVLIPNSQYSTNKRRSRQRISYNQLQHLLIGLCVGITLGILLIPVLDNHCYSEFMEKDIVLMNSEAMGSGRFLNISNHYNAKTESPAKKTNQYIRRPRFFSTELGLRKKIVCGVILTDLARVENVLAINSTLGPHVNQMIYFAVGFNWANKLKSVGLTGVVALSDKSPFTNISTGEFTSLNKSQYHRTILKGMRFLGIKLSDTFDYFFIGIDVFYINGKNLMKAVKNLSISQDVLWGKLESPDKRSSCSVGKSTLFMRIKTHT